MGKADLDKLSKEKNMDIDEAMLDFVSGGIYTEEEWNSMSYEEKVEAWKLSLENRSKGVYCQLD